MTKVIYNLTASIFFLALISYSANVHAQKANKLKIVSADLPSAADMNGTAMFKGYVKNISGLNVPSKELEVSYYIYSKGEGKSKVKSRFSKEVILNKDFLAPGDSIFFEHPIKVSQNLFDITDAPSAKTSKNVVIIWPVELRTQLWENAVNPIKHEIHVKGAQEINTTKPRH